MIFYTARNDENRLQIVGTQADAKAINKAFEQIDVSSSTTHGQFRRSSPSSSRTLVCCWGGGDGRCDDLSSSALALGAALGTIAVIVRQEAILVVMGGIFVIETLSVMIQVASFKLTGKRVFRMAPIHHHFELKGWPEPRVIVRFWIISFILVLVSLATLKVR